MVFFYIKPKHWRLGKLKKSSLVALPNPQNVKKLNKYVGPSKSDAQAPIIFVYLYETKQWSSESPVKFIFQLLYCYWNKNVAMYQKKLGQNIPGHFD